MNTTTIGSDNQDDLDYPAPKIARESIWGGRVYEEIDPSTTFSMPDIPSEEDDSSESILNNLFSPLANNLYNATTKILSNVATSSFKKIANSLVNTSTVNFASSTVLGYLKIPYLDKNTPERLLNLDSNSQLPVLAETIVSFINKQGSAKLGIPLSQSTQDALKPSIERILANLACYSPVPVEGENGQLLTNIVRNLVKILNPNEAVHSKILATPVDNEGIIFDLLEEALMKSTKIEKEIKKFKSLSLVKFSKRINVLKEEKVVIDKEVDYLKKLQSKYSNFVEQDSNFDEESLDEGDVFQDPCIISQRDWFIEEFSKNIPVPDFNLIVAQVLKASGVEVAGLFADDLIPVSTKLDESGRTGSLNNLIAALNPKQVLKAAKSKGVEYLKNAEAKGISLLGGYLAAALQEMNEKFITPSTFSPNESVIFAGHQNISEGIVGSLQSALPVALSKNKSQITLLLAEMLAKNEINGIDTFWIENFLDALSNPKELELQKSLLVIGQYISPHVIQALENLASKKMHEGVNLLNSALLNGIELFSNHFVGKESELQNAIISFDKYGIQAEAYQAYVNYIEAVGVPQKSLTDEEVQEILKEWDQSKIESLIASFSEKNHSYLVLFFEFKEGKHAEEKRNIRLMQAFGPLAVELINDVGLDRDIALSMFIKGDELVTKIAYALLEVYRTVNGPNDRTQGMGKVIPDFINNLIPKLVVPQNLNDLNKSSNYRNLLQTLTEGRNLSFETIQIFAKILSNFSSSWLAAIQNSLDSKTIVSKSSLKKLLILDPNFQLPVIANSLSKVGFKILNNLIIENLQDESRNFVYWNLLVDACNRRDAFLFNKIGAKATDLTDGEIAQICTEGQFSLEIFGAIKMYNKGKDSAESAPLIGVGKVLTHFFRNVDSKKLFAEKSKKCINESPIALKAYAAISNTTETAEFAPFVELFVSKTVQRILSNLACSCEDLKENGLISNIVKSLVSAITLDDHNEISSQKTGLDALEKILGEYTTAVNDCKELEANYKDSESLDLHLELIEKQKIVKELKTKISAKILHKAGLNSAADLQLVLLPFGNADLEDLVWKNINDTLPDLLIEFCKGLKYENLLSENNNTFVESLEGHSEIKNDLNVIIPMSMPKIFTALSSESNLSMISHIVKDLLDNMEVDGLERAWVEELLKTISNKATDEPKVVDTTIRHLWKILESIITPRLFGVMENSALHENVPGNFFERIIVNSVNVIRKSIDGNQTILNVGLKEYDEKSLKVEACDWRNRYLKDVKGVKARECDAAASELTSADIENILKLFAVGYSSDSIESQKDSNYSIKKIWALKKALEDSDNPQENIVDALTHFFVTSSGDRLKNEQQECLSGVFGPIADQVLKLTGFTTDKSFSIFDADLSSVRETVIPLVISIIYKDISDFKGVDARNNEKLTMYFGENKVHAVDALSIIAKKEVVAKSIKGYLKDNGNKLAEKLNDYLPASSAIVGNALKKFATLNSLENSTQLAIDRITSFVEDLVHANFVQVLTSACENTPVPEKQAGEGLFDFISLKASTIASYLRAPEVKNTPEDIRRNNALKKQDEIRRNQELERLELLKKRDIPSVLLGSFTTQLSAIFSNQRAYLKIEMAELQPKLAELKALAIEQMWTPEKLKEEQAKLRRPVFLTISHDFIALSGLSARNLYCPEIMQDEIWKIIADTVVPDLIGDCYSDTTTWELNLKNDQEKLVRNNIPNGPGAAKGIAHLAVKFVQSMYAVNGNHSSKTLFDSLLTFFKKTPTPEGNKIIQLLSQRETKLAFKISIDNNLAHIAKAPQMNDVFKAIEVFLEPIIDKVFLGLAENLNAVEESHPECLHEILKDSILATTEHFKKLRAVALSHDVGNAYELSQSQLMKGMTLNGVARKYVFLEAKVIQAQRKKDAAEKELSQWRLLSLNEEEKQFFELEKAKAENELKIAEEVAEGWVRKNWPDDNGLAIKNYLTFERSHTAARMQVAAAEKRKSSWFNWNSEKSYYEIQQAQHEFKRIENELNGARYDLKNQIIDPFSDPIYIKFLEDLEGDLTPENRIKVQKEMDEYTINLFKPLANDLLSLVNADQFDDIPFLGLLGEELKKDTIQEVKGKLPEILHQIFETVGEPATFLSVFNSILESQASSENISIEEVALAEEDVDVDDDLDMIGGQVVMEAIKLMPSRVEEALFMITKVNGATQETAGKIVGAQLRKFLKTQTLPALFNTILKSSITSILPKATWTADGELILGNEPRLPQTAAELKRVEIAKDLENKQLYEKVKNGLAVLSEEIIKNSIQDKVNSICKSVNNVKSAVIKSILNEERAQQVISALNTFTAFLYEIIASLIRIVAIPFWAVIRLFILAPKSSQIAKAIGSKGHKRLVFQLPVIFLEIIQRERRNIERKRVKEDLEIQEKLKKSQEINLDHKAENLMGEEIDEDLAFNLED